jgi:hypothetical protein
MEPLAHRVGDNGRVGREICRDHLHFSILLIL